MRRSLLLPCIRSRIHHHARKRKQSIPCINRPVAIELNRLPRQQQAISFSSDTTSGASSPEYDDVAVATKSKIHIAKSSFGRTNDTIARLDDSAENDDPTVIVDTLLERTKQLMDGYTQHYVAFSGGVDSSLVAALIHMCSHEAAESSTKVQQHDVHAILGLSPAVSKEQVQLAKQVASHIGVALEQIYTTEGTDKVYIANTGNACYACKTHLYTCMTSIINHASNKLSTFSSGRDGTGKIRLYNGTNADDLLDKTRSGLIAANEHNVQSPLKNITKKQVRIASRHLGLPNWNYAASPCLRSRLALGVNATPIELQRIEKAERYIRQHFNISIEDNLRVRLLSKNRAMIEIDPTYMDTLSSTTSKDDPGSFVSYLQDELGFASVGIRAFRSGSVATR